VLLVLHASATIIDIHMLLLSQLWCIGDGQNSFEIMLQIYNYVHDVPITWITIMEIDSYLYLILLL